MRILGITVREHIMKRYRPHLTKMLNADSRLLPHRIGKHVRLAGVLEAARTVSTTTGRMMRFLTMEDEYGLFEVTAYDQICRGNVSYSQYGPYIITGVVDDQYGSITVSARQIRPYRTTAVLADKRNLGARCGGIG